MHPPVRPSSRRQPVCWTFLLQLRCPPRLLSQKVAVDHIGVVAHTVAGAAICSCDRGVVNHALLSANVSVGSGPCGLPTFCSPVLKSVHRILAPGMAWNFRMSARTPRARSSSAVTPRTCKAVANASSVGASHSDRGHPRPVHQPVWPSPMQQPTCRTFLPQLLCPPCLLSLKEAGGPL